MMYSQECSINVAQRLKEMVVMLIGSLLFSSFLNVSSLFLG